MRLKALFLDMLPPALCCTCISTRLLRFYERIAQLAQFKSFKPESNRTRPWQATTGGPTEQHLLVISNGTLAMHATVHLVSPCWHGTFIY